jgi:hypothetical protein
LWRIGEPYHPEPVHAVEMGRARGGMGGFPPFAGRREAWTHQSLSLAIGRAVLGALKDAGLLPSGADIQAGERAGGYVRLFLARASEADSALFARSLAEALGPLRRPRYIIPRLVDELHHTWLSRWLPPLWGQYVARRVRTVVMLHAVPAALASSKARVQLYERHWHVHVSPGEALYARHGRGRDMLEEARQRGWVPQVEPHRKEVFV